MVTDNLLIGAEGWEHPAWRGVYYPEDLPEDWELGFYSNELEVVLVPTSCWVAGEGYPVDDWLDGVTDHFRFCLVRPGFASEQEEELFQACCAELGDHLLAVFDPEQIPEDGAVVIEADGCSVGILCDLSSDLRSVRAAVERLIDGMVSERRALIVRVDADGVPGADRLLELRTMIEMMGM